jgi:hypothetical protein
MLPDLVHLLNILAQTGGEGSSSFRESLFRILAVLCVLTILWLGVVYMLYRRTTERRRRVKAGLEPLPDLHISIQEWFRGKTQPGSVPRAAPSSAAMPDLGMLTGDFPQPDLSAVLADVDRPSPSAPADLEHAFELPSYDDELAATFALDQTNPDVMEEDEMPAPPDSIELLRVWRDLSDGSLIIEIGGQRFASLDELHGANLDRRFMNVVRDLTTMLRDAAHQPPAQSATQAPAQSRPQQPPTAPRPAQPDPTPSESAPDKATQPPLDEDLPSMGPGTLFRQMGRVAMGYRPEPTGEMAQLSIPDQIETLLQERLVGMPQYAGREIHVRPSPFGGVRIEVDGQFFDGLDEIPDQTVRGLIQEVVRDWEQGQ